MNKKEIRDYIFKYRNQESKNDIINALVKYGVSKEDVYQVYETLDSSKFSQTYDSFIFATIGFIIILITWFLRIKLLFTLLLFVIGALLPVIDWKLSGKRQFSYVMMFGIISVCLILFASYYNYSKVVGSFSENEVFLTHSEKYEILPNSFACGRECERFGSSDTVMLNINFKSDDVVLM